MLTIRGRWGFSVAIPIVMVALTAMLGIALDMSPLMLNSAFVLSLMAFALWNDRNPVSNSFSASPLYVTRFLVIHLGQGVLIGVLCLVGVSIVGLASNGSFSLQDNIQLSPSVILLIALAALFEELLFRGPIFSAIQSRFSGMWAVIVTSAAFGVAHMLNPNTSALAIVNVTLAGVFLGVAVLQTNTLWLSTGFHVAWNLLVALCFGSVSGVSLPVAIMKFDTSGINPSILWLFGGSFGIEEGALTTLALIIATIVVYLWVSSDVIVASAKLRAVHPYVYPETETL